MVEPSITLTIDPPLVGSAIGVMQTGRGIAGTIATRMKRTTISDVAKASGVSKTTVSKVMNVPTERIDVPESTRQRVLKASKQLGYQPSWRARAFARGRTHTIGLVHRPTNAFFASDHWYRMVAQLAADSNGQGYDTQFVPVFRNSDRWRGMLLDQRLDGCIIAHDILPPVAEALQQSKLPAILLNASQTGFSAVVPDDHQGACNLTTHLLDLGHRTIAFFESTGGSKHFSLHDRQQGFLKTMADAGLSASAVILSTTDVQDVIRHIEMAAQRPTAIIAYADRSALILLHACWKHGIRVPQDISVATFNDVPFTRYSIPPLTTVDIPAEQLAVKAFEMLLTQIESSEAPAEPQIVVVPTNLIVRESTDVPNPRFSAK